MPLFTFDDDGLRVLLTIYGLVVWIKERLYCSLYSDNILLRTWESICCIGVLTWSLAILLSSSGESGSETSQLMPTNQEFDTGNICVENWLTICNNLLMDHQQHYWYIKNSCRALQNTNNSICVLYTTCDWLAAVSLSHWTTEVMWPECSPLIGRQCRHSFPRPAWVLPTC